MSHIVDSTKFDYNYFTKLKMTQSSGWSLQWLQHSRNKMKCLTFHAVKVGWPTTTSGRCSCSRSYQCVRRVVTLAMTAQTKPMYFRKFGQQAWLHFMVDSRHSTHLQAWSFTYRFIFSQNTSCFTGVHQLPWQKFRCCGTAPMKHFAVYSTTDDQLRTV